MCLILDKTVQRRRIGYVYKMLDDCYYLGNVYTSLLSVASKVENGIWYSSLYHTDTIKGYRSKRYNGRKVHVGFHGLYSSDCKHLFYNADVCVICIKVLIVGAYRTGTWYSDHEPEGFSCLRYLPLSIEGDIVYPRIKTSISGGLYVIYEAGNFLSTPRRIG